MRFKSIQFAKDHNEEFYKVLKSRVNQYFKTNAISRHANANMVVKTVVMCLMYFVPFTLLLTVAESYLFVTLLWVIMGFGMAGLGLSVMHDANHGAYSKNDRVN